MSKGKALSNDESIPELVLRMAADRPFVTTGDIARAAQVSRQAAHYHVKRMVASGQLLRKGAGRGARYRLASDLVRIYAIEGLEEDRVWSEMSDLVPSGELTHEALRIVTYAFNEMLNNAIEHSHGQRVLLRGWISGPSVAFEVDDDGIGVFHSIRDRMGLPDAWAALQELVKGKATTAPEAHSGEGIFFTSKAVDLFELEDPALRWTVDNVRVDQGYGGSTRPQGTRVRFEISKLSTRSLAEVFDEFAPAEDMEFSVSRVPIRLFESGAGFVSRSEARRLASRLETFRRVELDFQGVDDIGQAFADELFRVWAARHPDVRLEPKNMSPIVARVVDRARTPAS